MTKDDRFLGYCADAALFAIALPALALATGGGA